MESELLLGKDYAALSPRLAGKVVYPGDTAYDAARQAWNASVDQRPALIIYPETPEDVVDAVVLSREQGLPVAVQSTGHGVIRGADGAALINTSRMKGICIDALRQTARFEAGVKWGEVLALSQAHGLAPLLGSSPDVGAVGYTLGGGLGWLARKYGLSIDSLLSVDLVTPDGVLRHASPEENQDLFWAMRGGGGGFGVVTGMEIRLHPVSQVYAGNLFYPAEMAAQVFERFNAWVANLPDELTTSIVLINYPPLPPVPEVLRGKSFVIIRGCYAGPAPEGERLLAYWRNWRAPIIDDFKPIPFSRAASISQDPVDPEPVKLTGGFLRDLGSQTAETLIRFTLPAGGPPALVMSEVRLVGGAVARADSASTAYSHRGERLAWVSMALLMAPESESRVARHLEEMRRALGDSLTGKSYMNFLAGEEARERTREGYSPAALERLKAIKARYDPDARMSYGYELS